MQSFRGVMIVSRPIEVTREAFAYWSCDATCCAGGFDRGLDGIVPVLEKCCPAALRSCSVGDNQSGCLSGLSSAARTDDWLSPGDHAVSNARKLEAWTSRLEP